MSDNKLMIYGFHAINSYLSRRPHRIDLIIIDSSRQDARMQDLVDTAKKHHIKIEAMSRAELEILTEHAAHQGVIAWVKPQPASNLEEFLETTTHPLFLLILDGVQDPHNLGACIRTADAAGIDAVITPKDRAVGITPVVSKVASGATTSTPYFQVTNLTRTLRMLQDRGVWLYGASEHATQLYFEVDLTGPVAIVLGSEGKGLRRLTEEACDFLIRIPMFGSVSSLNVSVATGVCLFEAVRQRQMKNKP